MYDRQTWADVTLTDNRDPGDVFDVLYYRENSNFNNWDVGTNKPITVTGIYLVGPDANNYSYNISAVTSALIWPRPMWGTFTAGDKVYDGNTDAIITSRTPIGVLEGDEDGVSLIDGVASFNDPNVGDDKPVTQVGMTISGDRAFNYILESVEPTTANITPLTVLGKFEAYDKIYDGNTEAVISKTYIQGILDRDTLDLYMVGGTAFFVDRNAGVDKYVGSTGFIIDGDAQTLLNYQVTIVDTANATIFPKPVDIVALQDIKVYDGSTSSNKVPIAVPELIIPDYGEYYQDYDDKNVGIGKTMIPGGKIYDGNNGNNYITEFVENHQGIITPLQLYGQITADNKVYDGNTDADITSRSIDGVLKGDNVFYVGGTATFDTPWVGEEKLVTGVGLSLLGLDARNYLVSSIAQTHADVIRLIVPAYVTVNEPLFTNLNEMVTLTAVITAGGPLMKGGPQAAAYTVFEVDGYIISDTTENVNIDLYADPFTKDLIATITMPLHEMIPNGIMEPGTKEVLAHFYDENFNYIVTPDPAQTVFDFAPNFGIVVYPNPSWGPVNFKITMDIGSHISLDLYDMRGRTIARLYDGFIPSGEAKIVTYESNLAQVAQGMYFYVLRRGNETLAGKVVLVTTMEKDNNSP